MDLKFGVIGVGGQGNGWCRRVNSWPSLAGADIKLVAVCDRDENLAKRMGEKYKAVAYTDYKEMLEKAGLDAVIIATPHFVHAPMAIAAAEKGVNVLTEKIMCINLEQADAMKAAVDKYGIKLAVGFQRRFDRSFTTMKNLVKSGDLGKVFQINMIFHWWRTEEYYLNSSPVEENEDEEWEGWREHWKTEGGGALANQIVHHMDLFQWVAPSKPIAVMAASRVAKHTFVETDDNTNIIIEFEDGSMGLLQAGVAYQHYQQEEFYVYGTEGTYMNRKGNKGAFGIPKKDQLFIKRSSKKGKAILKKHTPGISFNDSKKLLENFVESIVKDDASIISVDVNEGRKTVELLRAILLSQKTGKRIELPLKDSGEYPELLHTYVDEKFKDMV
jgi:UDP-N-acetyl-2-amino-2-deoxyglucuronate dehydrogenase